MARTYTLGSASTLVIQTCDGDLEVVGRDEQDIVTVEADAIPQHIQSGEQSMIQQCDDARFTVPRAANLVAQRVEGDTRVARIASAQLGAVEGDFTANAIEGGCTLGHVGGEARIADLGALTLGAVDGDARLERIARGASIGRVDGDIHALDTMNLTLGHIGGDARLEGLQGTFELKRVDGDAVLRGAVDGFGPTAIEGDLALDLHYTPGHEYNLTVDGDATVAIPEDADLTLRVTVGGDVKGIPARMREDNGAITATWGAGRAHLSLQVQGDLHVRAAKAAAREARDERSTDRATPPPPPAPPVPATPSAAPVPPAAPQPSALNGEGASDPALAVLEAVARGEISPAEAEDLLARVSHSPSA